MDEGLVGRSSSGGVEGSVGGVSMKEIFDDRRVPDSSNSGVSTEEQSFLSYVLQCGRTLDPRKRVLCLARLLQQEFTRMEAGEKQHLVKEMECYISDIFEEGQKTVEAETSPPGDKEKECENTIPMASLGEEQQEKEQEEHKDSVEDDDNEDEDEEIVEEDEQNNKKNKKVTKRNYYGHRAPLYWNGGSRTNNKKKHTASSSIAAVPNEQRLDDPSDEEEELSEEEVDSSPSSSTSAMDPRMARIFVEIQSHYDAVKMLMEQPEDVLLEMLKAMKSTTDEISTNTNEIADLTGLVKEFELPNDTLVSLAAAVRHSTTYKRIGVQLRALISVQLAQLQQTMSGRKWTPFRDRFCQLLGLQQRSIYKYAAVGRMLSASLALFCATLHSTSLSFNDLNLLQCYLQKEAEQPIAFLNIFDRTVSSHLVLKLLQYWITPSPNSVVMEAEAAEEAEEEGEQTQRNAKRPRPRTQPPRRAKRRA